MSVVKRCGFGFLGILVVLFLVFAMVPAVAPLAAENRNPTFDQWMFIGNYESKPTPEMVEHGLGDPKGIYVAGYDTKMGKIDSDIRLVYEMGSPNFLALSPN